MHASIDKLAQVGCICQLRDGCTSTISMVVILLDYCCLLLGLVRVEVVFYDMAVLR